MQEPADTFYMVAMTFGMLAIAFMVAYAFWFSIGAGMIYGFFAFW